MWVHEISLSALAGAVVILGVVLLLELRCLAQLRRSMDCNMARVFEQLDLLRFETQQLLEAQQGSQRVVRTALPVTAAQTAPAAPQAATPAPAPFIVPPPPAVPVLDPVNNATALAGNGATAREIADRTGIASGEARLLASLAAARARRTSAKDIPQLRPLAEAVV